MGIFCFSVIGFGGLNHIFILESRHLGGSQRPVYRGLQSGSTICQLTAITCRALTMTLALSYTSSMLKIMKENGLFDWDFVSTLSVMLTLIVLSEVL